MNLPFIFCHQAVWTMGESSLSTFFLSNLMTDEHQRINSKTVHSRVKAINIGGFMSVNFNGSPKPYAVKTSAFIGAKTSYSPANFTSLLLQKHPFPPNIIVTGNLSLFGCTGLTSLPNWITTLGRRVDGNKRQIYLDGIDLSEAFLNTLHGMIAPGIEFWNSNSSIY